LDQIRAATLSLCHSSFMFDVQLTNYFLMELIKGCMQTAK
jgi:hypothetical protein